MKPGRAGTATVLLASLILLVAACGSHSARPVSPSITVPLPVFSGGCTAKPVPPGGHATIRVKIVREAVSRPTAAEIAAGVCVDGQGPFTFLVDTGAAVSVIDTRLAERLHIATVGRAITNHTFGCDRTLHFLSGPHLSIGGVALSPQPISTGTLASPEVPGLDGLIGADILSRFGAVRFDFDRQLITVGAEGGELNDVISQGQPVSVDPTLRAGTVSVVPGSTHAQHVPIPGDRALSTSFVYLQVPVAVKGKPETFVVDTGAAQTALSPSLAKRAGRAIGGRQTFYGGLSCPFEAQPYVISTWQVGDVALPPQVVGAAPVPAPWDGLLGSGTLQRYSPVVVDFKDGFVLLGPAHGPLPAVP